MSEMLTALGIPIDPAQLEDWRGWFAPEVRPFLVDGLSEEDRQALHGLAPDTRPEIRDTFDIYDSAPRVWLDETGFVSLPRHVRSALTNGRLIWWPSELRAVGDGPLVAWVNDRLSPSTHDEVPTKTWRRVESAIPGARELAGTFPRNSGPNCFATVMAAAGVRGAEDDWMFQEPFEAWLNAAAVPLRSRHDNQSPGVVIVWRDASGLAQHAAITIGDGFALSKPSQAWFTPRVIWSVRETVLRSRAPGLRLQRYRLR